MLDAEDIVVSYRGNRALDGFTLTAAPGEIVGLVGHNGAGKTTFTRVVCGLLRPDSGRIRIRGESPRNARGHLGLAPQRLSLYPTLTVQENLRLFGGLAGLRRRTLAAAIDEIAADLHLEGLLGRRLDTLSGGQQRRTQAAGAMLHRPGVLLLDEPTAGVDPPTRQALLDTLKRRAAEGATILYTTHYLPELTELGATLALARNGRVIARGTAEELLSELPGEVRLRIDGTETRVAATDPAAALAGLLSGEKRPIQSVELRHPTLDDLYREMADAR